MAKLPGKSTCVEFLLSDGVGKAYLRAPSIEEVNNYQADRLRAPECGQTGDIVSHFQEARVRFFDLLLERFEDLDDEFGNPLTLDKKADIPAAWKSEAIARKFDVVPVNIKN